VICCQCSLLMEKNPAQKPLCVSLHSSSVAQQLGAVQKVGTVSGGKKMAAWQGSMLTRQRREEDVP